MESTVSIKRAVACHMQRRALSASQRPGMLAQTELREPLAAAQHLRAGEVDGSDDAERCRGADDGLGARGGGAAGAQALVQVSAGGGHSCAIKVDATLACWGSNSDGQATPPSGAFSAVDAGGLHTCAIRTDATLACWGKNDDGESTPPSGTFSSVSAGGDHSCGVRTDGTLACWGRNTQSPPFNVAPLGTYRAVSAGNTAGTTWSCAVATSGVITCWGYNSYGRGNPPPGTFTDAGAGGTHGCALDDGREYRLLGRLQLQRRAVPDTAGRDLHRRQRGL